MVGQGFTNRSEVVAVYSYEPATDYDTEDALQRFGKLKIEATLFTISEPTMNMEVSAMIYELATLDQKKILREQYDVKPIQIQTITMERIFVDKLFAAEAYVRKRDIKSKAFEAAKHIYDLAVMSKLPLISELVNNKDLLEKLLKIRMKEEINRHDGIPRIAPNEFLFFNDVRDNYPIINAYEIMQRQYVLRDCDRIAYDEMLEALKNIEIMLKVSDVWNKVTVLDIETDE